MGWREEVEALSSNRVWLPAKHCKYNKPTLSVLPSYEVETWLKENCRGAWTVGFVRVIAFLEFEDSRDLVLFKMFWSHQ